MPDRLKHILVNPDLTIKQALKKMDESGKKILFVVNTDNYLLGTLTDGDIRRWILDGKDLIRKIANVMNKSPVFLKQGHSIDEAKNFMLSRHIECIPVVNEKMQLVSGIWWPDLFDGKLKKPEIVDVPVVIMAGGEGIRLAPFTKILPKPLMPIGDKPIVELIIGRFREYGCKDFYLSINYKSNLIKAYFSDFKHDYNIKYIQEKMPLGTAGSLYLLKKKIEGPFFLTNCDILVETDYADILEFHARNKNKITVVSSMKHYTIPYGVCEIRNGGSLKKIKEKPEYDFLVNSGMYILAPEVLSDIPRDKFCNITDLINEYIKNSEKVSVYPISERSWVDMGECNQLQETLRRFNIS